MQSQTENDLTTIDPLKKAELPQIVIVTGYSGAGKNTVLCSLEDIGFFLHQ